LGRKLSEETKNKISDDRSGKNHPLYGKTHSYESKLKNLLSQSTRIKIEVTDLGWLRQPPTKITTTYNSIREATRAINCGKTSTYQPNRMDNPNITPVVVYENAKLLKKQIMQENKGQGGIYR
jgi:hypothetical protein